MRWSTRPGRRIGPGVRLLLCALLLAFVIDVQNAHGQPAVVGTIPFPGGEPLGLGVHEGLGKLFVTEDNAGTLYVIDGTTLQTRATIPVGGSAFQVAVNETYKKVYVASDGGCCTTGLTEGNGLISVIDAAGEKLITTIDPSPMHPNYRFVLANDEVHDKVYVAFNRGIGVIDAATDQFTPLASMPLGADRIAVNTVTNKAYVNSEGGNSLLVVDGATNGVSSIDLGPTGGRVPLDVAVSEPGNKVYVTMEFQPGRPEIGILILDLGTNGFKYVGAEDLEPLVFNQATNRLFSGVQVGQKAAVVDGATDALTYVDLGGAGIGASAVRSSSDNAYHANGRTTFVVNGASRCTLGLATGGQLRGGIVVTDVVVNQATGRVYVTNDQTAGKVTVIADGAVPCQTTPPGGNQPPGSDKTAPSLQLAGAGSQRVLKQKGIFVSIGCPDEACTTSTKATVSVPRLAGVFRFVSVTRRIPAGGRAKVRLKLSSRALRAIAATLLKGRRLTAKVTVTATDAAGNARTKKRAIRLRR